MSKINQIKRYQAIHLIKKYTSLTLLEYSYNLKKSFLKQFEKLLRHPSVSLVSSKNYGIKQLQHESEYINFLQATVAYEEQINQLKKNNFKNEAYMYKSPFTFKDKLFGRYADENGLFEDEFYQILGLGSESSGNIFYENDHTNHVRQVLISEQLNLAQNLTLFDFEYVIPGDDKIFKKWNFESLFNNINWPLKRSFDDAFEFNLITDDARHYDVLTGQIMEISGIYEPYFNKPVYEDLNIFGTTPYRGCPSYFLEGCEATKYKLEGTEHWYDVKWRLIWEDTRYIDGSIPEEEKSYIFDISNIGEPTSKVNTIASIEKLSVLAGKVCPKTGYWTTPAQVNSRTHVLKGEMLPTLSEADWGEVYWYYDGEE